MIKELQDAITAELERLGVFVLGDFESGENGVFLVYGGCEFERERVEHSFQLFYKTHSLQKAPDIEPIEKILDFFSKTRQIESVAPNLLSFQNLRLGGQEGSLFTYNFNFKTPILKLKL